MLFKRKKKQRQPAEKRPVNFIVTVTMLLIGFIIYHHTIANVTTSTDTPILALAGANIGVPAIIETEEVEFINLPTIDDIEEEVIFPFARPLPDQRGNNRSAQLTPYQLDQFLQMQTTNIVIRLNGNGKADSDGFSVEDEEKICAKYDVEFYHFNIHSMYKAEKIIHRLLKEGNVLIHCRHNMDRTGGMIAYHLAQLGFKRKAIITHNSWEKYHKKGKKYQVYYAYLPEE